MSRVVILSRSSQWGLAQDAKLVEQALREAHAKKMIQIASIDHLDPTTVADMRPVDIQIHLEIPCRLAWPWAKRNIVLVNPEWWVRGAWDWALKSADLLLFRSNIAADLFAAEVPREERRLAIPWRTVSRTTQDPHMKENKFLYLIGGSVNKALAAKAVVAAWRAEWPVLEIWGSKDILDPLRELANPAAAIVWNSEFKTAREKEEAQAKAKFHCVASAAEAFGYTMAEAASVGALPLWTGLPVHEELWGGVLGSAGKIAVSERVAELTKYVDQPFVVTTEAVTAAVHSLLELGEEEADLMAKKFQSVHALHQVGFRAAWNALAGRLAKRIVKAKQPFIPRKMAADELPQVAVITLTHNRPKWFANMSRNILMSDYPSSKLVWVVVDDGSGTGRVDDQLLRWKEKAPSICVEYVSLTKKLHVGEKRNRGVRAALATVPSTEIFLMMDDDDHYPKSSMSARVAYMKQLGVGCVYCSTIPMYDCRKFVSAMNVPPLDLGPAERVSEATLAFTRQFWEEREFQKDVSVAEGEAFLEGREAQTAEISPAGVIVSFLHGGNYTSRRVPETQEPNGCHYGFDDEYFLYLTERGEDVKTT